MGVEVVDVFEMIEVGDFNEGDIVGLINDIEFVFGFFVGLVLDIVVGFGGGVEIFMGEESLEVDVVVGVFVGFVVFVRNGVEEGFVEFGIIEEIGGVSGILLFDF